MARVMNVVYGIGIAVILYIVVLLGINVFYPAPHFEDYNCTEPKLVEIQVCNPSMTVGDCYNVVAGTQLNESSNVSEAAFKACNDRFQKDDEIYAKNFLLITNVIGVCIIFVSLFLFLYLSSMINLSAGTAFAGLILIFFGFARGWMATTDKTKFILGMIIAAVIISFAVIINKRYATEKSKEAKKIKRK
ncbi:hypothetical protein COS75_03240 [Candidatus Pacearchaeota archaeon CG06_land_8_20_14_3_00_35_12]|nr:MAG: hypothetical protein COS75_03240 [Candidatus Pacearchaeota archaeon CG06_land_8_20_14_3_00_35_12]